MKAEEETCDFLVTNAVFRRFCLGICRTDGIASSGLLKQEGNIGIQNPAHIRLSMLKLFC